VANQKVEYLTDEGRARLEAELEHLRRVRRPEIAERIRLAKQEGDVTDNAGYEDAKHEQSLVEGRIRELEALLERAVRIDPEAEESADVIRVGSTVTVVEDGAEPETYHIVGSAEADPVGGRISNECPLGRALLGHHEGELVEVQTPSGPLNIRILKVE